MFRILLGVGVGGDYPLSASVTSDRASIRKRGTLLSYIFANQGWGSLVGSLVVIIVLACYEHVMNDLGETSKVDGGGCRLFAFRFTLSVELLSVENLHRCFACACLRHAVPAFDATRVETFQGVTKDECRY